MSNINSLKDWNDLWEKGNIPWDESVANLFLVKHLPKLLEGQESITIFLPLCGKSEDLKWLYDQGHNVIGVDQVLEHILDFFTKHSLEYVKVLWEDIDLYQTHSTRLKIYHCDVFKLPRTAFEEVDAVWDRAAFAALEKEDRIRYVECMTRSIRPKTKYLLDVVVYDDWFFSGVPRTVPDGLVKLLFGSYGMLEELDEREQAPSKNKEVLETLNVPSIKEKLWLLTIR